MSNSSKNQAKHHQLEVDDERVVVWGSDPQVDSKNFCVEDLYIKNRFDFGGDADILVQNFEPVPIQYKKTLLRFKNLKKKTANDTNF